MHCLGWFYIMTPVYTRMIKKACLNELTSDHCFLGRVHSRFAFCWMLNPDEFNHTWRASCGCKCRVNERHGISSRKEIAWISNLRPLSVVWKNARHFQEWYFPKRSLEWQHLCGSQRCKMGAMLSPIFLNLLAQLMWSRMVSWRPERSKFKIGNWWLSLVVEV